MPGPGGGYANARMRNVDPARFAMQPRADVPRSVFTASPGHKTTFDAGYLIPAFCMEVLPGDSISIGMSAFCRLATPVVPIMDNLYLESFWFFVPNRLVWDNWARFMGEQTSPTDSTQFLVPQVGPLEEGDVQIGGVYDYYGITHNTVGGTPIFVNALPFRGMRLIWNEWFRDEDLQNPVALATTDGPDLPGANFLLRRNKRYDYFTSARPWPQKPTKAGDTGSMGGAGPFIPGYSYSFPGAGVPVSGIGIASGTAPSAGPFGVAETGTRTEQFDPLYGSSTTPFFIKAQPAGNFPQVTVAVNDIRTANAIQILLEKSARGGTRYTEKVLAMFGVRSPDARLQRPEFLGHGSTMIHINPVAQTSATGEEPDATVLGELAGVGSVLASPAHGHRMSQSFTEHGYLHCFVNVRADITYQQGIERFWWRRGEFDFYVPPLAFLGEQAIHVREIYAGTPFDTDDEVFGYQERWSEYRQIPSRISGGFRSKFPIALDMWHLAEDFGTVPALNSAFIESDPPVARVLQVDTTAGFQFLYEGKFDIRMARAMPMFSIPGLGPRL